MDDLGRWGRGRLVLRALAILGALGFLALVMVQAMAFYAPQKPATSRDHVLGPATKSAPVVRPPPLDEAEPEAPPDRRLLLPETKAGTLGPLRGVFVQPAPRPPQQQGTRLLRK